MDKTTIINAFLPEIGAMKISTITEGHINDTYLVQTASKSYILQRINHHIFTDVELLQNNILLITEYIRKKLEQKNTIDIHRKVLHFHILPSGKSFYQDEEGNYWRLMDFVIDSRSYNSINPELAYKTGKAFGEFQAMLSDIPNGELQESIPNFHNIEFRLKQLNDAVEKNAANRLDSVKNIYKEIEKRAKQMCKAEELFREGKLPKRINHCDTKVNNILFDQNGEVLCIIDLDTVMPGYVLSDFGDFIRTAGNMAAEDEADLEKIKINFRVFEAFTEGYLSSASQFLTDVETENLIFGATLLTYMQTVRFFTDYLNGDTYYKIHHPEHNLQRTKAQLKFLEELEANSEKMNSFVMQQLKK